MPNRSVRRVPRRMAQLLLASALAGRAPRHPSGVREGPIEFAGLVEDRTRLEVAALDADHGHDLAEIPGREDLVGVQELAIGQRPFVHRDARLAQEPDDALAR